MGHKYAGAVWKCLSIYDTFGEESYKGYLFKLIVRMSQDDTLTDVEKGEIANTLLDEVTYPGGKRGGRGSRPISLKPTGKTRDIMRLIPVTEAPSQFFRRMIMGYCKKPFGKRERTVFKETYTKLCAYCDAQQAIRVSTIWNPQTVHELVPYCIASGVEEMYNYLLCQEYNAETNRPEARAYMLHRIASFNISPMQSVLDEGVKQHLLKMMKLGPQYAINDDEEVCVKLNEKGQEYYSRIYFGRPRYDTIIKQADGYYQYYHCSMEQVFLYFRRFDPINVEILYPESLRDRMREFYRNGIERYAIDEETTFQSERT